MKRLVSAALVGVLAIGTVAATSATAGADPYWQHHHSYPHYNGHGDWHGGGDDGAGYLAAGIIGLTAGLVASQAFAPEPPPPPPYYPAYPTYASGYGGDASHIQWCEATYRSYDPETDLWRDFQGYMHRCQGPY
jgi:hypothetical protein